MPGGQEAGHLSSPADASLDSNADTRSSKSPSTAPKAASGREQPPPRPTAPNRHRPRGRPRQQSRHRPRRLPRALPAMPRARTGRTRCWLNSMQSAPTTDCSLEDEQQARLRGAHPQLGHGQGQHAEPPTERRGGTRFSGLRCWIPLERCRRKRRLQRRRSEAAYSRCRRRCTTRSHPTTGIARTS